MGNLSLDIKNVSSFVAESEIFKLEAEASSMLKKLKQGEGKGSDFKFTLPLNQ